MKWYYVVFSVTTTKIEITGIPNRYTLHTHAPFKTFPPLFTRLHARCGFPLHFTKPIPALEWSFYLTLLMSFYSLRAYRHVSDSWILKRSTTLPTRRSKVRRGEESRFACCVVCAVLVLCCACAVWMCDSLAVFYSLLQHPLNELRAHPS